MLGEKTVRSGEHPGNLLLDQRALTDTSNSSCSHAQFLPIFVFSYFPGPRTKTDIRLNCEVREVFVYFLKPEKETGMPMALDHV